MSLFRTIYRCGIAAGSRQAAATEKGIAALLIRSHFINSVTILLYGNRLLLCLFCCKVQHHDTLRTAAEVNRCQTVGAVGDLIIGCCCQYITARDIQLSAVIQPESTITACNDRTARNVDIGCSLYCIISSLYADIAGNDVDQFLCGLQAICGSVNGYGCTLYGQGLFRLNCICIRSAVYVCIYLNCTAVQVDVLCCIQANIHRRSNLQRTRTIFCHGQLAVRINNTAGINIGRGCRIRKGICSGNGQLCLYRRLCIDTRCTRGGSHRDIVQNQFYIIGIRSGIRNINQNLSICHAAIYGIRTGSRDGNGLSADTCHALCVIFYGNAAVAQMNCNGIGYRIAFQNRPLNHCQVNDIANAICIVIGICSSFCGECPFL